MRLEGPVYKRETILLGNNLRKQVGINMDWGIDVAKSAMFVAVSVFLFISTYCIYLWKINWFKIEFWNFYQIYYFVTLGEFKKLGHFV